MDTKYSKKQLLDVGIYRKYWGASLRIRVSRVHELLRLSVGMSINRLSPALIGISGKLIVSIGGLKISPDGRLLLGRLNEV